MPNTGSVSPDDYATVQINPSEYVPSGYALMMVSPSYSGDNGFVWVQSRILNESSVSATVRNVASTADSGAPRIYLLCRKS